MMTAFLDWYQALPPYLRAYWTIAIAVSIIFLIQMTLTLIGLGDTDAGGDMGDLDTGGEDMSDGNGDTMDTGGAIQLFTIRNTVNFLLGVGWGGVCLSNVIENRFLLAVAAILCGCIMVAAFIIMYRQLMKLEGNGSYRIEESVGQVCEVYIRIPGQRSGSGKVQISFHGSVQELPAQTEGDAITSGTKVRVTKVIDRSVLIVEPLA
ncbi:MAG: NfeD family protein [Bacteroidaceae bacterium]|nr:NfeD family protein [Bacteroidaceae bacterium]